MSLFRKAFSRLFGCFTPFLEQRKTQQCAVQELASVEKHPESEALNLTANLKKSSKKQCKRPKKSEKVKHLQTSARPTVLKPLKGKQPKFSDNSGDFTLPAACFQPLPPVRQPVCLVEEPQEEFTLPGCPLPVHPPKVLATVLPRPVPAPDTLFARHLHLKRPLSPIPAAHEGTALRELSPFCLVKDQLQSASTPDLILADIEDEESEFVETIKVPVKPESPRPARKMLAWVEEEEEDDKMLKDESWTSEPIELQDLSESGDSEAVQEETKLKHL